MNWNGNVVILTIFSSLAAPKVVKMTIFGVTSDENFNEIILFPFQCIRVHIHVIGHDIGHVSEVYSVTVNPNSQFSYLLAYITGPLLNSANLMSSHFRMPLAANALKCSFVMRMCVLGRQNDHAVRYFCRLRPGQVRRNYFVPFEL